jgi:hypothetical protein
MPLPLLTERKPRGHVSSSYFLPSCPPVLAVLVLCPHSPLCRRPLSSVLCLLSSRGLLRHLCVLAVLGGPSYPLSSSRCPRCPLRSRHPILSIGVTCPRARPCCPVALMSSLPLLCLRSPVSLLLLAVCSLSSVLSVLCALSALVVFCVLSVSSGPGSLRPPCLLRFLCPQCPITLLSSLSPLSSVSALCPRWNRTRNRTLIEPDSFSSKIIV